VARPFHARLGQLVGQVPPELRGFVDAVAEYIEVRDGGRLNQDQGDRFVTVNDLLQADLAQLQGRQLVPVGHAVDAEAGAPGRAGLPVLQIPPTPAGFLAVGGFNRVLLRWNNPAAAYANHGITEIWRAQVDDLAQAVRVDQTGSFVWADADVAPGRTYYYWIRFVSSGNRPGPYNSASGTAAATAPRSEYVRDSLTAGAWQADHAFAPFEVVAPATPVMVGAVQVSFQVTTAGTTGAIEPDWASVVALGDQIADGTVVWTAVDVSTAPFIVGQIDGHPVVFMPGAVIQNASIDDAKIIRLAAEKLFAVEATVFELLANAAEIHRLTVGHNIQSDDYVAGVSGWRIAGSGDAELNSATLRGQLVGVTGTFSGSLTADAVNAVDTINLAGQAVTIPVSAYTASFDSWDGQTTYLAVQQATIGSSGAPIYIHISFYGAWSRTDTGSASAVFRLRRRNSDGTDTVLREYTLQEKYNSYAVQDTPGAGSVTYYLEGRVTASQARLHAGVRMIFLLETKR
jgi:hypothetical protein